MIRLTRKGLPLLLPLIAVVVSYLPPLISSPGTLAPARPAAAVIAPPPPRPRPQPSNLPPASFVPAPLQAALAAARGGHPTTLPSLDTPPPGLPAAASPESTAPFHPLTLPSGVQGPLQPPTAQDIAAADQALAAYAVATQARHAAPAAQGSAIRADATSLVVGLPPAVAATNEPVQMSVQYPITEPVIGSVYASVYPVTRTGNFVFSATPMSPSLVTAERFPSITFDNQNGTPGIPFCQPYVTGGPTQAPVPPVTSGSRPFADTTPQDDGSCQVQYLQSSDIYNPTSTAPYRAGFDTSASGGRDLREFQTAFTATVSVVRKGPVTFSAIVDDSAILSVGPRRNDPTHVQPTSDYRPTVQYPLTETVPVTGPFTGYPTMAGFYQQGNNVLTATVDFPAPGLYPIEVDYVEVQPTSNLSLILTADEGTASRLAGQRDCGPCDATLMASDFPTALSGNMQGGDPFNTRNGNLFETATDLVDPSPGRTLLWARTYNSQSVGDATNPSGLGPGWQTPYATRIISSSSLITVVTPEGNQDPFVDNGDGTFRPFPGDHASLARNADGTYTERTWAQETITFTAGGLPTALADAHNRALQLVYDPAHPTQLVTVYDASYPARALTIAYNNPGGTVRSVTNAAGESVGYTYDPTTGDLTGVTDLSGRPTAPTTYTYQGQTHLLTAVVNALGQPVQQTAYDTSVTPPRVSGQTEQDGAQLSVAYAAGATTLTMTPPPGQPNPTPNGQPLVETVSYDPNTDAMTGVSVDGVPQQYTQFDANFDPAVTADGMGNAHATITTYNRLGLPLSIVDPLTGTTTITYDAQDNPVTITDPLGHQTVDGYDANNNLTTQSSGGVTTTVGYGAAAQPADTTAPDGTTTHDDYDPATNRLITSTVRSPLAPGQPRITAYGYDAQGRQNSVTTGYGTAAQRTDLTVYNDDGTIARTVQNAVGSGAFDPVHPDQNVATTYGYDAAGRRIWTRDARGRDAVTHYNAAGQTDWTLRNAADPATGQPALPATLSDPAATPPAYSPALPDANVATLYGYDGLGRQALVTQTGILTGTFNAATQTFSAATTRVTRTEYDVAGRPVTTTRNLVGAGVYNPASPDQNVQTVAQYDAAGNAAWQRDALGRWTYTQYDGDNRPLTTTVNYASGNPLQDTGLSWSDGSDVDLIGVTHDNADGTTRDHVANYAPTTSFDPAHPITDVLTQDGYDGQGRPVTTTADAYTSTVGGAPVEIDAAAPGGRPDLNRTTVISDDVTTGSQVGQRDALGRWAATRYGAFGQAAAAVRNCYTMLPGGSRVPAAGGCAPYTPAYPDQNLATATGYDAAGRVVASTDALGNATTTGYDGLGRTVAVTAGDTGAPFTPAFPDRNLTTRTAYDALGQTQATTDALGIPTIYGYNGLGQTVAVTTMATVSATRVTRSGYDGSGATRWTLAPDGHYTVYQVDGLGRVITTTQNYTGTGQLVPGRTDTNLSTGTVYDAAGRSVETSDPAGRVISTTYNLRDQLVGSIQNYVPAGQPCPQAPCNVATSARYDRAGNRVSATDADGNTTTYGYDAAGEGTSVSDALGETTATAYDAAGRVITATDALGRLSVTAYDGLDEVISATSGITGGSLGTAPSLGATTLYTYSYGLQTDQGGPDGVVTHDQRDAQGRAITTTVGYGTAQGRATAYGYDGDGRTVTTTVGAGTALARADVTLYNPDGSAAGTVANSAGGGVFSPAQPDRTIPAASAYDAAGRRVLTRDALGHTDATHYDGAGRPDWTVRNLVPVGVDANGLPLLPATPPAYTPAQPDQNVATYDAYDLLGHQTLVTRTGVLTGTFSTATQTFSAAATRTTRTNYDALGRPITTTLDDQPGAAPSADTNVQAATQYDAAGNVTGQRDPLNRWTDTQDDAANRPVTVTANYATGNPLSDTTGLTWTTGSDVDLRTVTRYRADGSVDRTIDNYVTGTFNPTAPITDRVTAYGYDGQGRAVTTTVNLAPGASRPDLNRGAVTAYDALGHAVGQQDALGRWTATRYDPLGQATARVQNCADGQGNPLNPALSGPGCAPFSATYPDRNVTSLTRYDGLGRASQSVDALGHVTSMAYDGLGRTVTITQDDTGAAFSPAAPDQNVATQTAYDALGRTVATTDALGIPTTDAYDGLGQTVAVTTATGPGTGSGTGGSVGGGRVARGGDDGTGSLRWTATADGRYTVYQVDGLGRVITTTVNDSATAPLTASDANLSTGTQYDAAGRAVAAIDALGRVTAYGYDLLDHQTSVTRNAQAACPTGATDCNVTTLNAYDRAGNRIATTDPDGHTTTYGYDAAAEQVAATDALSRAVSLSYDQGGRLVGRQDARGASDALTYGYDGLDRLTTTASPGLTAPIGQRYDALGRRTSLTDGSGTTAVAYDALGRTVAISAPGTGTVGYGYDADGRRTGLRYPDGTALAYAYNADATLQRVTQGGVPLASYSYDAVGRLRQETRLDGAVTTYRYDGADRTLDKRTTVTGVPQSDYQAQVNRLGQRTVVTETVGLTPIGPNLALAAGSLAARGPFAADAFSNGGAISTTTRLVDTSAVTNAAPMAVYQSERTGNGFNYYVHNLRKNGTYTARLHFAEIDGYAPGQRTFNVTIGSTQVLTNFDIAATAGASNTAVVETVPATADSNGNLYIAFNGVTGPAAVSGIELAYAATGGLAGPLMMARTAGSAGSAGSAGTTRAPSARRPASGVGALDATGSVSATGNTAGILRAYARLPLRFEPNAGQTDAHVLFAAHGAGYGLFLTAGAATLVLAVPVLAATAGLTPSLPLSTAALPVRAALRLRLVGADPAARLVGQGALPGVASYLLGRDSRAWRTGLPTYSQVAATGVYSGINLTYDGTQGRLEYSFVVAPGADPAAIGLAVDGARGLALDASGALTVTTAAGPLAQAAPLAYQEVGGRRVPVAVRLVLSGASGFGFVVGTYDHRLPLTIDPVLGYGTYLGGSGTDQGNAVAVDRRGDAYVTGQTASGDYITATGALSPTSGGGGYDAFVTELNPQGTGLVYSTYLGGSGTDVGAGIAVDAAGDAYVVGHTDSPNVPLARAYQGTPGGGGSDDAFLTELGPRGTAVLYSTLLGGNNRDEATGVALDGAGDALVTGLTYSPNFPTTAGTLHPTDPTSGETAFVARVNPAASGTASLVYSTYLGGTLATGVAADGAGDAYVVGDTAGGGIAPTAGAAQGTPGGGQDAFVAELNPTGTSLVYATYLGGSGNEDGTAIALDGQGRADVTGDTNSSTFPTTAGAAQTTYAGGSSDAFVTVLGAGGTGLVSSTYLGGGGNDGGTGIAVDGAGNATVTGNTTSGTSGDTGAGDFPLHGAAGLGGGSYNAFVASLTPAGALRWSTFLDRDGGTSGTAVAVDCAGNAYGTGQVASSNLVTTTGAPRGAYAGGGDGYAVKLGATRVITYAYDGVNRVTEAATCPGNDYQYSYDLAGNRTGETLNGALAQRLGYDAANAVVTATTPAGTAIYGYDGAGNLLGDGTNSYSYDALSRLTALTPLSGTAPTESYGYNGDGTLVTQTVGGVPTQYAQDLASPSGQSQVLAATTGTGAPVTTDYLYGSRIERLAGQAGGASGTRTWYGTDLAGSVRSTTDDGANLSAGSGATVASPAGYDPYGTPEWRTPPAPFGYTGELQDPGTGLVNLRARTYNPLVGQFLTRDPLEQQTGQAYAYAGSDPVNNADPSGQDFLPQNNLSPNADSFYDKLDSADQVPNSGLENITSGLIQDFVARSSGYAVGPVTIQNNGRSSTVDVIDFNPHPQGGHIQAALYQFVRYSSGCDGLGASCAPSQDGGSYTSNVRYLGRYDPSGDQTLAGALDEVNTFLDQARKNPLGFPSAVERIIQRISPGSTCTQGTLDFTTLAGHYPLPLAFAAAGEGASQQPQPIRLVRSGIVLPSSSPGYNGYLVNARQHGETLYGGDYGAGGVTDFPAFSPSFNNIVAYNVEGGKQDQSAITGYKYQYYAPCTSSNSEFFHRVDGVATCAGYVGTALDAAAFILLLVPGGQPFAAAAAALGATATVLNTTTTGYQTARLVFDQGYRDSPQNRAGVILGIGSLALGVFGNALTKRAVQQAEGEVNAAIARGAPKAAIESLMGAKEDTERLAHFANAYFASDVVVLDLANQFQQAQPGPSATDVVGPSSTADLYIVARVGTNDGR